MSVNPTSGGGGPGMGNSVNGDWATQQQQQQQQMQQQMQQMQNSQNQQQQDGQALLAQQQALMAMAGGNGFDAGASREALMNLLTRQGFGGGGMGAAGMGGVPGQQSFPGMAGLQSAQQGNPFGALGGFGDGSMGGAPGTDNGLVNALGGPNPAFSGFSPGMGAGFSNGMLGGMGGGAANLMGGAGMGGSVLGASNLLGTAGTPVGDGSNNTSNQGIGDGSGRGGMDAASAGMAHQNMLLQQVLSQQAAANPAGSLWQQYGNMQGTGADGMMGGAGGAGAAGLTQGYLSMLGPPGAGAGGPPREAGDAGVFQAGALPDFAKSGKKSRPKKPKNKPKRPLSAYNIFFKDERAKILAGIPDKKGEDGDDDDDDKKGDDGSDEGEDGKSKDGDGTDENGKKLGGKKRKRVPHGKIGFESLAKIVGQRWKELPPDELEIYKKRAEEDMKRYRKEMEAYVQKQREGLEQSREHLEKLVDEETKKRYFGDATSGV